MNGQAFLVTVTDKNGKVREKIARIGGGTATADQLAQQYVDVNAFPEAKTVKIQDAEDLPSGSLISTLQNRRGLAARLRPKVTPTPIVVTANDGEREATLRVSKTPGVVSGEDGVSVTSNPTAVVPGQPAGDPVAVVSTPTGDTLPPAPAGTTDSSPKNAGEGFSGGSGPMPPSKGGKRS